jgi:hypothetical protein
MADNIKERTIQKVVRKVPLHEQGNDFAYWQSQPYMARIEALEQIREEYILWKYGKNPGFQRVYRIVKQQ